MQPPLLPPRRLSPIHLHPLLCPLLPGALYGLRPLLPQVRRGKVQPRLPNCPLCNVVVPVKPGQDANHAVEAHFAKDCAVMTGRVQAKKSTTPVCARARCGKALFAPIKCTKCSQQFCAAHRFPADHTCTPPSAAQTRTTGPTAGSRLLDLNAKASAAGGAALGAIKTMASNAQAQANSSSSRVAAKKPATAPAPAATSASASKPIPNLFSKTDRSSSSSHNFTPTTDTNVTTTPPTAADETTTNAPEPAIQPLNTNSYVPPPYSHSDHCFPHLHTVSTISHLVSCYILFLGIYATSTYYPYGRTILRLHHPRASLPPSLHLSISLPYPYICLSSSPYTSTHPSRARAERESRRRGLQERARKGLLSEEEKAALAREEAEDAAQGGGGSDKKECLVM
ncbi:hypothetical protein K438DRAFT_1989711 [Mycena galopus ATCC 62051]|nr:hypothetical protein K438DRAFT_1989711 [Mycena galopus ATCC 62051]